ncbi:MAG: A/G-specific adenine glycosylase [Acidimicrobiales bacterium]
MTTSGRSGELAFRRALRRAGGVLARPLPWIGHGDPWAVLVSEVMLQQTSTARVVGPWTAFLERFPTPTACADASLADVLRAWSRLGYPRRARALHRAARVVRDEFAGRVPGHVEDLRRLPGVGPSTAAAVASFAFGERVAVLDTNVGRVLARAVANAALTPSAARELATRLLPRDAAPAFNQAIIDLGAQYCRAIPRCATCPLRRTCRWRAEGGDDPAPRSAGVSRPQPTFAGSNRQIRGWVMGELRQGPRDLAVLAARIAPRDRPRLTTAIEGLVTDGLVERTARGVSLAEG